MSRLFMCTTRALCPVCSRLVDAKVFAEEGKVFLEKLCLQHGKHVALISSDYEYYRKAHEYIKPGRLQARYFGDSGKPCPGGCGLCPDHEQHVCMPVLEITGSCNLNCPICIAEGEDRRHLSLDEIQRMVEQVLESERAIDVLNVSGGEPTLHPRYEKILDYLTSIGEITRVSVSTNGLRFVEDKDLFDLHQRRAVIVSLQLDGHEGGVYRALRGRDIAEEKRLVVQELNRRDMDWSIIMTVARGINDDIENIGYVYDLFMSRDNILSLLFQPLVYTRESDVLDRVTIPDVIRLVEQATRHGVEKEDFIPLPCCNANCFALIHFLKVDQGRYAPLKRFIRQDRYIEIIKNRSLFGTDEESFDEIKDTLFDIWADTEDMAPEMKEDAAKALKAIKGIIKEIQRSNDACCDILNPRSAFDTASRKIKSIYIHHFMDKDTFELSRVRRCCTVYPKPDGKQYPICSYNNLYRRRAEARGGEGD